MKSHDIKELSNKFNLRVYLKTTHKFPSILVYSADRINGLHDKNCVYKIGCSDYATIYVKQKSR